MAEITFTDGTPATAPVEDEEPTLRDLLLGPKRITGEEGTVEERSVKDLIEADRYTIPTPEVVPYGMKLAKIRFPGTT